MNSENYVGKILCANPNNPKDGLDKSSIIIINHNSHLAVGIQINKPLKGLDLQGVAHGLDYFYEGDDPVYYGGNLSTTKINVVHSLDWAGLTTTKLSDEIAVTTDIGIISAICRGEGPEYFRACAGFWIWEQGHLEIQMDPKSGPDVKHRWESIPATISNVFEHVDEDQWISNLEEAARHQVNNWFNLFQG